MPELPRAVEIQEEGPREGFQIEPGPIATASKIELIDALSGTGLKEVQVASFVSPKRVPGWADAQVVVEGIARKEGVRYTGLWLNERGFLRAVEAGGLHLTGSITAVASESFLQSNQHMSPEENVRAQHNLVALYQRHGVPVTRGYVQAAFGCNFQGDIPLSRAVESVESVHAIAAEHDVSLRDLTLADTMGWATPQSIKRVVGAVRERWPALRVTLHLHDTRGMGIANAYAGLEMGVDSFDASVAGLGGCPFAGHKGAAGNVCTEDLALLCEEMGISTGIDLEKLIEAANLAERIVGHPLPGSVMRGGSLAALRAKVRASGA